MKIGSLRRNLEILARSFLKPPCFPKVEVQPDNLLNTEQVVFTP